MTHTCHVFLVPGFFGFANLGEFRYFGHVRTVLGEALRAEGIEPQIHDVVTRPTASLVHRAERLAEAMMRHAGDDALPIHIIGHSSGGLDARLLMSPGSRIASAEQRAKLHVRVRSVVTVATPHFGTPVATFFSTLYGQKLLRLLSLATIASIRSGAIPVSVLGHIAALLAHPVVPGMAPPGITEQLYHELLADFALDRRQAIEAFFSDVAGDTALLVQLRPESAELLNALTPLPASIACGSVVTAARPPRLGSIVQAGVSSGNQASRLIYSRLHKLAAGFPARSQSPLGAEQALALAHGSEILQDEGANDGMVPTRSQIWREVIGTAVADHLDVIGHYAGPGGRSEHHDWLFTGSGFDHDAFLRTWRAVAAFIARASRAPAEAGGHE